jgi:hypothetical protein
MQSAIDPRLESSQDGLGADDGRLELVNRITASKHFIRSPRLAALLVFLCDHSLRGEAAKLTESRIANQVFGRKGRFDPNADTIVRSHMVRLRQKLVLFFQEEGASEPIRISIPRGGYAPLFEDVPSHPHEVPPTPSLVTSPSPLAFATDAAVAVALQASPETVEAASSGDSLPAAQSLRTLGEPAKAPARRRIYWFTLPLLLIALAVAVGYHFYHRATLSGSDLLWAQMMPQGQPVMLIAADSSLVLLHFHMLHDTSLADYTSGRYLNDVRALKQSGVDTMGVEERRYTSIVDLQMTQALTQLAMEHRAVFKARYPRDINLEDVKKENVIVSGSLGANPWLELYEPMLNFNITGIPEKHIMIVTNRAPRAGEEKTYIADQAPEHSTYGVLAFLPGIKPSRNALILQGTSVAGTEAISDLVFDQKQLGIILQGFKRPDGTLPHFEVLLAGQYVNGTSSRFKVVASRTYP